MELKGLLPLSEGFEEEDGGGDGDVEGVEVAEHRDADVGVGGFPPEVGQAGGFGAHYDCGRLLHICVVVEGRVLKLRGEYLNMPGLEPGDCLFGGGDGHLSGEHSTDAGPDEIRIVEVGERIADDYGVGTGCVSASEHGSEVAWFLHALKDNHQRILAECQAVQSPVTELDLSDDTLRAASIGNLAVKFVRNLHDTDFRIPAFGLAKKVVQFLLGQDLPANEQCFWYKPGIKTVAELPAAFDHEKPFRPPQL